MPVSCLYPSKGNKSNHFCDFAGQIFSIKLCGDNSYQTIGATKNIHVVESIREPAPLTLATLIYLSSESRRQGATRKPFAGQLSAFPKKKKFKVQSHPSIIPNNSNTLILRI